MNQLRFAAAFLAALGIAACGGAKDEPDSQKRTGTAAVECSRPNADGVIEIQGGLVAKITRTGYGRAAESKDYADVHATLWLYDAAAEGGRGVEIWSSGGVNPFQFQLDSGQVIAGWDLGVRCMLIGEKRELRIAPELGYGERGKPPVPPNATLLFEIELVNLTAPN
jgi:FKBP-type peptidyl-prolyl cis-trans isomerase FkpA